MMGTVAIPTAAALAPGGVCSRPVAPWGKLQDAEGPRHSRLSLERPSVWRPCLAFYQSPSFRGGAIHVWSNSRSPKRVARLCVARVAPPEDLEADPAVSAEEKWGRPSGQQDSISSGGPSPPISRLLEEVRKARRSSPSQPPPNLPPNAQAWVSQALTSSLGRPASDILSDAGRALVRAALSLAVREEPLRNDETLEGNWGPVPELGHMAGPLPILEGHLPADLPLGTYIRNGPNPRFPPLVRHTPWGSSSHHLFEGDGMLHATAFTEEGVFYTNRFVATEDLLRDQAEGRSLFWGTFNADPAALVAGFLSNLVTGGTVFKKVANTSVLAHHGRVLALNEAAPPVEIRVPSLETVGEYTFNGEWQEAVTAHPKVDQRTGELVFFCYRASAPHVSVGVASPAGHIIHRVDLDAGRATPMHDFAITPRYTVLVDEALTISPQRLLQGQPLVDFEPGGSMRFGILPRFGDAQSVRWFEVEPGFTFHFMNAYEDGAAVVVHAFRQRSAVLRAPAGQTWAEFLPPRFVLPDGELLAHLYEWRFDLETGRVSERQLGQSGQSAEFPRINDTYAGIKYRYGYGAVTDLTNSVNQGKLQLYGAIAKYHLPAGEGQALPVKTEIHSFGPGRYGGEATFVPRASPTAEDDGWLLTYVYDENTSQSELYIIDAQNMEAPPTARIGLPGRVPYGFHGTFVAA